MLLSNENGQNSDFTPVFPRFSQASCYNFYIPFFIIKPFQHNHKHIRLKIKHKECIYLFIKVYVCSRNNENEKVTVSRLPITIFKLVSRFKLILSMILSVMT